MKQRYFLIDFDSTIVKVEALDELARIALEGRVEKEAIVAEVEEITNLGMEGKIGFEESLTRRLALFAPKREHVEQAVELLRGNLSESVKRNREFFCAYADNIYIISGGFKDMIVPIATELGIEEEHVLANDFLWDGEFVVGFDRQNLMAQSGGKVKQVGKLKLEGELHVVGDGFTDYQIREAKLADSFWAFVENIRRPKVVAVADRVVENFDEFIINLNLKV